MRTQERNAWHALADLLRGQSKENKPTACSQCVRFEPAHRIDKGLCPACKANIVHSFRRQLRHIEWALSTLDARNPEHITDVRKLTTDHAVYRDCLREHGIIHPAPVVHW